MSGEANFVEKANIYVGVWTNWSDGPILGRTLTISKQKGVFLTAFLSILITYTGGCFWGICRLLLHRRLSSNKPKDTLYHQRQAILRNTENGLNALWRFFRLSLAWRKRKPSRLFRRIIPFVLLSFLIVSSFAAASILSAKVANSMGNYVLLASSNCGWQMRPNSTFDLMTAAVSSNRKSLYTRYLNYADYCYGKSHLEGDCRQLIQPRLSYKFHRQVECPFLGKDKVCQDSFGAIRLDTGYIDSNTHLGLNSMPEHRYMMRLVEECAPLNVSQYTSIDEIQVSDSSITRRYIKFLLGQDRTSSVPNVTRRVPADPPQIPDGDLRIVRFDLGSMVVYFNKDGKQKDNSLFTPIPEITTPNADLTLLFLQMNDIRYAGKVYDQWFSAQTPTGLSAVSGAELYVRDAPARVLGCASKVQYCTSSISSNKKCTELDFQDRAQHQAESIWSNKEQKFLFEWSIGKTNWPATGALPYILGGTMLIASRNLPVRWMAPLPDNQWELEVEHLFQIKLAGMQHSYVTLAAGPSDPDMLQYWEHPSKPEEKRACNQQKVRSDAFTSFSVFGLSIIIVVSALTIIISMVLENLMECIYAKTNPFLSLEWRTMETLQLQRLAHETLGAGNWFNTNQEYPITEPEELLAILDILDYSHPILKLPPNEITDQVHVHEVKTEQVNETEEATNNGLDDTEEFDNGQIEQATVGTRPNIERVENT